MSQLANVLPLSGFRDFGKQEQANRLWLVGKALAAYNLFGYMPIETPALEREEILQGQYGEEGDSLRYKFVYGNQKIGLRYDHTVPFARYVARFLPTGGIGLPYRRSVTGPVWRGEKPQKGRFREFWQGDFDIAGADSATSDAEIVLVAETLFASLGVDFRIKINDRGLLDGILRSCDIPAGSEQVGATLTVVDKLAKDGVDAVRSELIEKVGLSAGQADDVLGLLSGSFEPTIFHRRLDRDGVQSLENLRTIEELAKAASADPSRIDIDLSVARGLLYYNAFVIETGLVGAEEFGSVLGGGRFDNTIGVFLGRKIPAVGASLGIDRCLEALGKLNALPGFSALSDIAIASFSKYEKYAFGVAQSLRRQGLSVILPSDLTDDLRGQVGYASKNARFALIIGDNEREGGYLTLRDLSTRQEWQVKLGGVIDQIRR